jgi:hypothetical protein
MTRRTEARPAHVRLVGKVEYGQGMLRVLHVRHACPLLGYLCDGISFRRNERGEVQLDEWLRKGARNVESARRRGSMGDGRNGLYKSGEYDVRA